MSAVFEADFRGQRATFERLADGSVVIRAKTTNRELQRVLPKDAAKQRFVDRKARGWGGAA